MDKAKKEKIYVPPYEDESPTDIDYAYEKFSRKYDDYKSTQTNSEHHDLPTQNRNEEKPDSENQVGKISVEPIIAKTGEGVDKVATNKPKSVKKPLMKVIDNNSDEGARVDKVRVQLYFSKEVTNSLKFLSYRKGKNMSSLVEDIVISSLGDEIDKINQFFKEYDGYKK
jgi:hypothetical protein